MWHVITEGQMKNMKANSYVFVIDGAPQMIEKPRVEYNVEDKKEEILYNVANYILYKTLDKNMLCKITMCTTPRRYVKSWFNYVKIMIKQRRKK